MPAEKAKTVIMLFPQWSVCSGQALHGEEHGCRVRRQVRQEAPESGQQTRCAARGDREGGGHPAAAPAPQCGGPSRRLRESDGRSACP